MSPTEVEATSMAIREFQKKYPPPPSDLENQGGLSYIDGGALSNIRQLPTDLRNEAKQSVIHPVAR